MDCHLFFTDSRNTFTDTVEADTPLAAAKAAVAYLCVVNGWNEDDAAKITIVDVFRGDPLEDVASWPGELLRGDDTLKMTEE